ncbi:MAG TPA: HEAT repeat domain-containing protein [Bryobacteraceae bacterium]|nr:HEAT repeat domain-containing protein [Bryobacteraceae bacterium]
MTIGRGLLLGCAATALLAQEAPIIDREEIRRALDEARQVQEKIRTEWDFDFRHDMFDHKELMANASTAMAQAKEAMKGMKWNMAFDMQGATISGAKSSPPLTPDEEMKLMAIDSIMQSDAERAIPVVEKVLHNQQASIRLRMRALQALARSNSPKGREVVTRVAKDSSNVELQSRAIQLLGERDGGANKQLLGEIYSASTNNDIKRQVLRSLGHAEDWQKLLEIAKTEKDEELRSRAIQQAASMRNVGVSDALAALYTSTSDTSTRNAILRGLSQQRDAKQLIAVARTETNPELKRAALKHLSRMKGDDVTAYLTELLAK